MRVGLFIPCYIDQFYPQVGLATLEILERFGVEVDYPPDQTCCGQPMANTGCVEEALPLIHHFAEVFADYSQIVCPSGSCTSMVRNHFRDYCDLPAVMEVADRTYELCEFLTDVLGIESVSGRFARRVGLHASCHGLRELRLASGSERTAREPFDKTRQLLAGLQEIQLIDPERSDECCGFGGTFAVSEYAVSARMGRDRVQGFLDAGAEVITAGDMSCLMHLEGLIRRDRHPVTVMHVAEILNEAMKA